MYEQQTHNKPSIDQMPSVIAYLRKGWKIEAIKAFRTYYGPVGLKEAKDACEAIAYALNIGAVSVPVNPPKYIVLDRNTEFGDFDLTYCHDKEDAVALASNLVTNSHDVIMATVVSKSERITTLVMKDA